MPSASASGPQLQWEPKVLNRYRDALRLLYKKLGQHRNILQLEYFLVQESEDARQTRADPFAARRKQDRSSIEAARKVAHSARVIARYMREYPQQGGWIAAAALFQLRDRGLRITFDAGSGSGISTNTALERLFDELAGAAMNGNPAGRGPWLHRFTRPGAIFEQAIDKGSHRRALDKATILGFHLVWWLRAMTVPTGEMAPQTGSPMPTEGRPHYAIAEEFIAAALGKRFDLRKRLREHPQMQYFPWN